MAKPSCRLPAVIVMLVSLFATTFAAAQARFDLTGPKIDIHVGRAGVSLPIASVPNLQPGDQIWLHPDLPPTQSVKYLLIAAFLRGTTNPPPDEWFTRIETWNKHVREEGVTITVPPEAQQVILFLAPETGGDFSTLRSAVKGRPGVFVRADQDLIEAGFEQSRIEKYIAEMKNVPPGDQAAITLHSNLLARTLNLRPNPDCFKKNVDQQPACLTQTGSQSLLDDGHGQNMADTLNNSVNSDLIYQASNTRLAGEGSYSAYVGAIVDLIRITSSLHTAQFQYIPAIGFPAEESLNLRLNTAPSFHNPKSVIVIGLPAVQKAVVPPLRPAEPNHTSCLLNPKMVLPVDGAPLVFTTAFAHQLVLHMNLPAGTALPADKTDIPLTPDAFQGGLTIAPPEPQRHELPVPINPGEAIVGDPTPKILKPANIPNQKPLPAPTQPITGTIKGLWGFDSFTGPTLTIQAVPGGGWHILKSLTTPENLIAGEPNHLAITSTGTACIESIGLEPGGQKVYWKVDEKPDKPDHLEAKTDIKTETKPEDKSAKAEKGEMDEKTEKSETPLIQTAHLTESPEPEQSPMPDATPAGPQPIHPVDLILNLQHAATPGSIQLAIQQFGQKAPDHLGTKTFSEPARIESVQYHSGDSTIQLSGTGLDEVKQLSLKASTFIPPPPDPQLSADAPEAKPPTSITFALAKDSYAPAAKPNERLVASIQLKDGRNLDSTTFALPPRPAITILTRRVSSPTPSPITLSSPTEVPLGSQLLFFLKSKSNFPRSEQIEIANADSSLTTRLNLRDSTLVMQDSHTVLATFDPLKLFGPSAFGPFRLRPIAIEGNQPGTEGEWQPLATVVRLPTLTQLDCSPAATASCLLTGQSLYLIDSVATTLPFTDPSQVPEGFVDTTLAIPHPTGPIFYLRLRDDPSAIQQVTLASTGSSASPSTPGTTLPIKTAQTHPTHGPSR